MEKIVAILVSLLAGLPLKSFNQVHVNSQFFSSVWWRTFYTFNDAVRNLEYRTQTTECPTVCSPLQVVVNAKGKRRLVLDLRYVNHYLCQSKFKYEGLYLGFVYTTATTFSSKRASFFVMDLQRVYIEMLKQKQMN